MIDLLAIIFDFFAICFLLLIVLAGVMLIHRAFKAMFFNSKNDSQESKESKQIRNNINGDSEGDGLVLFDDPLFPEEFDEDDDW
jgi:hypothetical protein